MFYIASLRWSVSVNGTLQVHVTCVPVVTKEGAFGKLSQAISSHVPVSQIWAAFQVTYCNAALNVGVLPAWHAHCAYSWESFPLAVIAGLCPLSRVPARTMTWKAKWDRVPLLYPLHLGWATESVLRVSCLIVLRIAESVDYPHMLRESMPCLKAVCIAPDSLYL